VKQTLLVKPFIERFNEYLPEIMEWKNFIINDMVILKFIKSWQIKDFITKHADAVAKKG